MNPTKLKILAAVTGAFVCGTLVCLAITTLAAHHQPAAQALPHWANRELAEAGYATPEAALMTLLWSIDHGDNDTFLDSLSPDASAKVQKAWHDRLDAILATFRSGLGKTTDFQIVSVQSANNATTIDLLSTLADGRNYDRKFTFKQVGGDWKCDHVFPLPHVN